MRATPKRLAGSGDFDMEAIPQINPAMKRLLEAMQETFKKGEQQDRLLTPLERSLLRTLQTVQYSLEVIASDDAPQDFAQQTADYIAGVIDDALGRATQNV